MAALRDALAAAGVDAYIHAPYGINVASANNRIRIPSRKLLAQQLEAAAANPQQAQALGAGGFLGRTPLWYYLLAEAKHPDGGDGQRLGPVGSTIVAEVLIGLVRRSQDSILRTPGWTPSLPSAHPGRFELADLLRFARVLRG